MSTTIDRGTSQAYPFTKKESTTFANNQFVKAETGGTGKIVPATTGDTNLVGYTTGPHTPQDVNYALATDIQVVMIDGSTHLRMDVETTAITETDELKYYSLNTAGNAIDGSTASETALEFRLVQFVSPTQGVFICVATTANGSVLGSNGFAIVNTSTNNTISVDQNGNVGTDVATDGAIHIENTGNTGIGLGVYTNIGATADAPLVYFKSDNSAFDQPLVFLETDSSQTILILSAEGEARMDFWSNGEQQKYRIWGRDNDQTIGIYDLTRGRTVFRLHTEDTVENDYLRLLESGGKVGIGKNPSTKLDINLSTEDFGVVDAGSVSATEQDWVEVNVGGNTGYIRVYATK